MNQNEEREIRKWHTIPILLGLLLIGICLIFFSAVIRPYSEVWSIIFRDIGFVFAPVATLALLYQHLAESKHSKYIAKQIFQELKYLIRGLFGQKEVLAIYPDRSAINFHEYFNSAKQQIDILTTNLTSLVMYTQLLIDKAKDGIPIRILTLIPNHEFLRRRFRELNFEKPVFLYNEMITSLREFCSNRENKLSPDKQKNLTIKIYNNLPSMTLFRSDDRMILGVILRQGRSREYMHIEFDCFIQPNNPKYCQCLIDHFNNLWKEASEITLNKLDEIIWTEEK